MTIETAYAIATRGLLAEVQHSLDRFSPSERMRDAAALLLRAVRAMVQGDITTAVAVLQRATEHERGLTRQYLTDVLLPLLISTDRLDLAERVLEAETEVPESLKA